MDKRLLDFSGLFECGIGCWKNRGRIDEMGPKQEGMLPYLVQPGSGWGSWEQADDRTRWRFETPS